MIDKARLQRLVRDGNVRYSRYPAPCVDLYILGSETSLKALVFNTGRRTATLIEKHFRAEARASISLATGVLDAYFNSGGRGASTPDITCQVDVNHSLMRLSCMNRRMELDLSGCTEKELLVYRALVKIPAGKTISYGALAERAGIPGGARFVGNAMAKNIYPIIIPCHRVVKSDGSMGNYSGGAHIKKYLLKHESTISTPS
jgi:O-6-methylguanine DNA methyltransferase